jgi:hypothetical protein
MAVLARGSAPLEPPGAPMAPGRQAGRPHRAGWPGGTPPEPPLVSASRDCVAGGWALMA